MNRDEIVAATYEAGRRLNLIKCEYGVIEPELAEKTDQRISQAMKLMTEVDRLMALPDPVQRQACIRDLKHQLDHSNLSTVCDKGELEIPVNGSRINVLQAAGVVLRDWWKDRHQPVPVPDAVEPAAGAQD